VVVVVVVAVVIVVVVARYGSQPMLMSVVRLRCVGQVIGTLGRLCRVCRACALPAPCAVGAHKCLLGITACTQVAGG
jgi:hypothetical protein